jgi:fibrillarin-like pre-rRNA processing protein
VDFLYQDISQRNQAEIFIKNLKKYLKDGSQAIIMIKARSIDVSIKPSQSYKKVFKILKETNLKIIEQVELEPYKKDHAAIIVTK